VGHLLVRSTSAAPATVAEQLQGLDCGRIRSLRLDSSVELAEGVHLDADTAQRLASAVGAAIARSG
jgi:hypothetical protein